MQPIEKGSENYRWILSQAAQCLNADLPEDCALYFEQTPSDPAFSVYLLYSNSTLFLKGTLNDGQVSFWPTGKSEGVFEQPRDWDRRGTVLFHGTERPAILAYERLYVLDQDRWYRTNIRATWITHTGHRIIDLGKIGFIIEDDYRIRTWFRETTYAQIKAYIEEAALRNNLFELFDDLSYNHRMDVVPAGYELEIYTTTRRMDAVPTGYELEIYTTTGDVIRPHHVIEQMNPFEIQKNTWMNANGIAYALEQAKEVYRQWCIQRWNATHA